MRIGKSLQSILLIAGLALIAFSSAVYLVGRIHSRMSMARFHSGSDGSKSSSIGSTVLAASSSVDTSLWSEKRIRDYGQTLLEQFDQPLAVLRIEKIHLEVPVLDGTDERVLNRGVGRIIGTARPGTPGNIGIAGHRDGFFRGLKDISLGDTLQLETKEGTQTFTIDSIKIVSPHDVSVLRQGDVNSVTLVTCFPFYFIGDAPQRYIVRATSKDVSKTVIGPVEASFEKTKGETK
jgi:sortase A